MGKLFFIGDSITVGAWDDGDGWANRLSGRIMAETIGADFKPGGFYCLPYNLGVSGNTVGDVTLRLQTELTARLDGDDWRGDVQIVYSIGINDSVYLVDENRPRFSDEEFHSNLNDLIEQSQEFTGNISFIGLTPVDDSLLNPIPWAPEEAYANVHVERFEAITGNVCQSRNLPFLPLFASWQALPDYQRYLIDGVHPNTNGHALLAQQIGEFLITDDFFRFHAG